MGDVIRVAIADDHPVVRRGLRAFLDSLDDIEVVGEAVDGEAAVRLAVTEEPDVLLLDLKMPKLDGIGVISRLRSRGASTRILVLTSFTAQQQVIPAIQAGADGYLLKDADPSELERAIRAVYRGEPLLAPEAAAVVMAAVSAQTADLPELDRLTPREREVLAGLGRGLSNRGLAEELFISEKTIKTHVSSILMKLGLTDRVQAALFAVRVGLADPRDIGPKS
ncbi:MAG: response regulator transcription factor [Acidobacteria bacterium]|nr:response regulator transcription factor [Acidobacteriota bacterium]MCH8990841.1 response regulator transcription factor [Acidobacteriota bacterium]